MVRSLLLSLFFLFSSLTAKAPALNPHDAKGKIGEILRAHACHHSLNKEIIKRSYCNMIEELDSLKLYFLESEVRAWLTPEESLTTKTLEQYHAADFSEYQKIHQLMEKAIERRSQLEKQIQPSVEPISPKAFKDLGFAQSPEELLHRLCQVKSLHIQTLTKLKEDPEKFFIKMNKRRLLHEAEIVGKNAKEKEEIALTWAIKSIVSSLDSQTHYFTPKEAHQFLFFVDQRLFGIGATLRDNVTGLNVVEIIEGSPAHFQGKLKVGDTIIAVDQQSIMGMDISEAVELIRGPAGSSVKLTILKESEETYDLEITRGEIVVQERRLEKEIEPYGDGVIAILKLHSFYQDEKTASAKDVENALKEIRKDHLLKGVILDLRNNMGGRLPQAVAVAGAFMKPGIVVSVKDNTTLVHHLRTLEKTPLWEGPLVILMNKASASAAEIVAQSLQDYGRALVIGDKTSYGKGTFQTFTLTSAATNKVNPKGEYKVTRGLYYTVSGKSPQLHGVLSDIVVEGTLAYQDVGESFSKYPLQPDEISPNFEDKMEDLTLFEKIQVDRIYDQAKQARLTQLKPYIGTLKANSNLRLTSNKSYQDYLDLIQREEIDEKNEEKIFWSDFQLEEGINVLKDLIFIEKTAKIPAA